jgi:hypothetical protein
MISSLSTARIDASQEPAEAARKLGVQNTVTCPALPRFVDTRGGDYFFLPSISAVAGLAIGSFGKSGHRDA